MVYLEPFVFQAIGRKGITNKSKMRIKNDFFFLFLEKNAEKADEVLTLFPNTKTVKIRSKTRMREKRKKIKIGFLGAGGGTETDFVFDF